MHKSGTLRATLEGWRGRKFSEDEAKRFDLESLVGVNALLQVEHRVSETSGETFANVRAVLPPSMAEGTPIAPDRYTRVKDRDNGNVNAALRGKASAPSLLDDPMPSTDAPASAPFDPTTTDDIPF